jgi:hypothetical protein
MNYMPCRSTCKGLEERSTVCSYSVTVIIGRTSIILFTILLRSMFSRKFISICYLCFSTSSISQQRVAIIRPPYRAARSAAQIKDGFRLFIPRAAHNKDTPSSSINLSLFKQGLPSVLYSL